MVYTLYNAEQATSQPVSQQQQPTQQVTIASGAKTAQRLVIQREQLQQRVIVPSAAVLGTVTLTTPVRPATAAEVNSQAGGVLNRRFGTIQRVSHPNRFFVCILRLSVSCFFLFLVI